MKKMKKSKGLSLVELLVAVAISSIVMLMVSSIITSVYNSYTKDTVKAELQNTVQTVYNSVADAIMEGQDYIQSGNQVWTSTYAANGVFDNKAGKQIYYNDNTVYLATKGNTLTDDQLSGSMLGKNVTKFSISVSDDSKVVPLNGDVYYKNPIKVVITIEAKYRGRDISYTQSVNMRNRLTSITVDGTTYEVK